MNAGNGWDWLIFVTWLAHPWAWLGWLTVAATIDLAIWIGIGLLFVFGYVGGRLRGDLLVAALVHGCLLAVVGIGVLLIKYVI